MKAEDNDELLTKMQFQIDDSIKGLKSGLDQMKKFYEITKKTMDDEREFENNVKKAHRVSTCLCNLAHLLTEFGPIRQISSLREVESKELLDATELRDKVLHTNIQVAKLGG